MERKEILFKLKKSLKEIMDITPYDLINFESKEEEREYIESKTDSFDLYDSLINKKDCDGIIVISEDKFYAISPVFIHADAYRKFFKSIDDRDIPKSFDSQDIISYYNDKGYVLFRVVNNNDVIGCDPYLPEKLNDYQIRKIDNITRDLNRVHSEIEDFDKMNDNNIKYAMSIIKNSIKENEKVKHL